MSFSVKACLLKTTFAKRPIIKLTMPKIINPVSNESEKAKIPDIVNNLAKIPPEHKNAPNPPKAIRGL